MKYSSLVILDMELNFGLYQRSKLKHFFLQRDVVLL